MSATARLVTIPFSHYCEKARWALDRASVAYREEPHLPMFAWLSALRAGRRRTVPVLCTEAEVLVESRDIVRFADRRAPDTGLLPRDIAADVEAFEDEMDRRLGPAARRVAYFHLMAARGALEDLFYRDAPAWEIRAAKRALPAMVALMKKGLKIDEAGVARSEAVLDDVFAAVERRLADGRRWLFGDRFTAADLVFAALAAPVVAPPAFTARFARVEQLPDGFRAVIDARRATPAGRFALRAYEEERARRAARAEHYGGAHLH